MGRYDNIALRKYQFSRLYPVARRHFCEILELRAASKVIGLYFWRWISGSDFHLMRIFFGKFTKIFVAVIGGNAIYYLFEDKLPAVFHHKIFALDWGLLLDFWICVFLWGLLDLFNRWRSRSAK